MSALGHLADDASWLTSDNAEARYDHVGRYDGAIEDADVVLDDGKLADDDSRSDMDVAPDLGGLDDRSRANEDVVVHSQRHIGKDSAQCWWSASEGTTGVGNSPLVESSGWPEAAPSAEETIAANGNRCVIGGRAG